jgi:hypothetical protein
MNLSHSNHELAPPGVARASHSEDTLREMRGWIGWGDGWVSILVEVCWCGWCGQIATSQHRCVWVKDVKDRFGVEKRYDR